MTFFKDKYKIESNRLKNWNYSSNAIYFITFCSVNRECIFGVIENEIINLNENGKIVEDEICKSIEIRKNWIFHNWIVMPNHVHLLIEINDLKLKFNFSETKILNYDIDLDIRNCFVSGSFLDFDNRGLVKTDNVLSLLIAETDIVETDCSPSLPVKKSQDVNVKVIDMNNSSLSSTVNTDCCPSLQVKKSQDVNVKVVDMNNRSFSSIVETDCSPSLQNQNLSINSKLKREANSISSFVAILKSLTTKRVNKINKNYEGSIWQSNYHDHIVRNKKEFEKIYYYIENNVKNWNLDSLKK